MRQKSKQRMRSVWNALQSSMLRRAPRLVLEVSVNLGRVAARPLFRLRRAGPVDLEKRAGDVGDAQFVLFEYLAGSVNFVALIR